MEGSGGQEVQAGQEGLGGGGECPSRGSTRVGVGNPGESVHFGTTSSWEVTEGGNQPKSTSTNLRKELPESQLSAEGREINAEGQRKPDGEAH